MTISPLDLTSLRDVSDPPAAGVCEPPPVPPPQPDSARARPATMAAIALRRVGKRFMAVPFVGWRRALQKSLYFAIIRGSEPALKQAEWGRSPTAATTHPPNVCSGMRHGPPFAECQAAAAFTHS